MTITQLITVDGCSRSSISDAVDTLCAHGLVERTASGLIPHPEQLARVAEDLGATEALANQLASYTTRRRIWHAWLARHDENTADTITERDLYDGERDEYWLPHHLTTSRGPWPNCSSRDGTSATDLAPLELQSMSAYVS